MMEVNALPSHYLRLGDALRREHYVSLSLVVLAYFNERWGLQMFLLRQYFHSTHLS